MVEDGEVNQQKKGTGTVQDLSKEVDYYTKVMNTPIKYLYNKVLLRLDTGKGDIKKDGRTSESLIVSKQVKSYSMGDTYNYFENNKYPELLRDCELNEYFTRLYPHFKFFNKKGGFFRTAKLIPEFTCGAIGEVADAGKKIALKKVKQALSSSPKHHKRAPRQSLVVNNEYKPSSLCQQLND